MNYTIGSFVAPNGETVNYKIQTTCTPSEFKIFVGKEECLCIKRRQGQKWCVPKLNTFMLVNKKEQAIKMSIFNKFPYLMA